MRALRFVRRVVRELRGAAVPLGVGAALWASLSLAGVAPPVPLHAGALLAAFGLAFSPRRGQADRVLLSTLSVLHLGVASTAAEDPTFLALLAAYAMLLCRALLELERFRRRAAERESARGALEPIGWKTHMALTSAVLGVALLLFLAVPRPSHPLEILVGERAQKGGAARPRGGPPKPGDLSGLDPAPSLRKGWHVSLDSTPAGEVRILDENGNGMLSGTGLHLRGTCFETYDDGQWLRTTIDSPKDAGANGWTEVARAEPAGRRRVLHEVSLFTLSSRVLLALPEASLVQAPRVWMDGGGNLQFDREPEGEVRYRVVSWAPDRHPRGIDDADIPAADEALTRMPAGLELVTQVARRAVANETKPWAKAKRIQEMLETEFEYNLSPGATREGVDPVVDFLHRGSGYCIHFASAMVLMLRSVGVPARLATGYLVREWNEEERKYVVRNWDAHAWVEVPFPGYGWIPFDPSPVPGAPAPAAAAEPEAGPAAGASPASPGVFSRAQLALARFGGKTQARAWGSILAVAWRLAPLLLACAGVWWIERRHQARRRGRRAGVPSTSSRRRAGFFEAFVRLAGRRGLRRPAGVTPMEFALRAHEVFPGLDAPRLASLYYDVRYGERVLTPSEGGVVRQVLDDLASREARSPREIEA